MRGAAVTPATDVFAFGATLAFALTGDTPFGSGASSEVMLYRVVHEEPELSGVPAPLAPLVRACLAKEPAERPPAAALHERLSELAARGAAAGPAAAGPPYRSLRRRSARWRRPRPTDRSGGGRASPPPHRCPGRTTRNRYGSASRRPPRAGRRPRGTVSTPRRRSVRPSPGGGCCGSG